MKKSKLGYWCFLLPSLLAFLIVELIPAATGLGYSLTDWNGISGDVNFVGLKNYLEVSAAIRSSGGHSGSRRSLPCAPLSALT